MSIFAPRRGPLAKLIRTGEFGPKETRARANFGNCRAKTGVELFVGALPS